MDLMELLPNYYEDNETMKELQKALSIVSDNLEKFLIDEFIQVYSSLATYDLDRWEKIFNIKTDITIDDKSRRELIQSKMSSVGTSTIKNIELIVKSFTNGDVEIKEDPSKYTFTIKFISIIGPPPRIDVVERAIEEIKPAHLSFKFIFKYNTYKAIHNYTHMMLSKSTYVALRNEVLNG